MLTSFTPFYELDNANQWVVNRENWTYTAEATEFNQRGMELESKDALGRYSAATYGFNQSVAKSVATNSRLREVGYDGFEDRSFNSCGDNHFKFEGNINGKTAHTGYHSIVVTATAPVTLTKALEWCDKPGCAVIATLSDLNTGGGVTLSVTPSGGEAPYLGDFTIINGSPTTNLDPQTGTILFTPNGDFEASVTFVDAEGCSVTYTVGFNNNQSYIN